MSRKYGGEEFAIQVKGMECPMHDPRALWSMALGYATSIRGACHNRDTNLGLEMGMDDLEEMGFARTRPQRREGKAMQTILSQAVASVCDSAVICIFAWKGMGPQVAVLRDMINAATGYDLTRGRTGAGRPAHLVPEECPGQPVWRGPLGRPAPGAGSSSPTWRAPPPSCSGCSTPWCG